MEDLHSTKDDSLNIASKCWERVVDMANKVYNMNSISYTLMSLNGYREGIQDGEDDVLQEGFDIGYKDGFEAAFMLGKYKSLSVGLSSNIKVPVDVAVALDRTKRGACWICTMETQDETSKTCQEILFSEVLNNQRGHSEKVINMLSEYFQQTIKESDLINSSLK